MAISAHPDQLQQWEQHIVAQKNSGLSIERWCHQNGIAAHRFHYWKSKLASKPALACHSFTELTQQETTGIRLECGGFHIHVDKLFDALTLKQCLQVLKEMSC